MQRARGFTLIEILVVLAIAGILTGIAFVVLPNDHAAVNQAAYGFAQQFPRARIEALKNDAFAGVTVSSTGSGSYSVCVDANGNGACDAGEAVQTVSMGQGSYAKVRITCAGFAAFMFDPRGIPRVPTPNTACPGVVTFANRAGNYSVDVAVTAAGKASVQ